MPKPPKRAAKSCPVCGKPASQEHGPFCGRSCRDRDLLQWLGEGYRVPGPSTEEIDIDGLDSKA